MSILEVGAPWARSLMTLGGSAPKGLQLPSDCEATAATSVATAKRTRAHFISVSTSR